MLREHPGGLTTHDLVLAIMRSRQMNVHDREAVKLIQRRAGHSLHRLRDNGFILSKKAHAGGLLRWRLNLKGERAACRGWRDGRG